MSAKTHSYDVWFLRDNTVFKGVPFQVVSDWAQQGRLGPEDRVKPTDTKEWGTVAEQPLFEPYLLRPEPRRVEDEAEMLEPVELDFAWKRKRGDEDDDVDMIPLIDISLVLLIFFMMTTTVAAISKVSVPDITNAIKIDSAANTICVYLDKVSEERVEYGIGKGSAAPEGPNANLTEAGLMSQLGTVIGEATAAVKIRIAAHRDLAYEQVERVMKELDRMKARGVAISEYTVEVGERANQ
jgi:biopolymer transport protein ExbD